MVFASFLPHCCALGDKKSPKLGRCSSKHAKGGPLEEKKFKVLQSGRNLIEW